MAATHIEALQDTDSKIAAATWNNALAHAEAECLLKIRKLYTPVAKPEKELVRALVNLPRASDESEKFLFDREAFAQRLSDTDFVSSGAVRATWEQVEQTIRDGIDQGLSVHDLSEAIHQTFEDLSL